METSFSLCPQMLTMALRLAESVYGPSLNQEPGSETLILFPLGCNASFQGEKADSTDGPIWLQWAKIRNWHSVLGRLPGARPGLQPGLGPDRALSSQGHPTWANEVAPGPTQMWSPR